MKLRSVSAKDLENAIQACNIRVPAGEIRNGQYLRSVEVSGVLLSKELAEKIFVKDQVKLSDITDIEDSYSEKVSYVEVEKGKKN